MSLIQRSQSKDEAFIVYFGKLSINSAHYERFRKLYSTEVELRDKFDFIYHHLNSLNFWWEEGSSLV
jgi:hypothetical protein